MHYFNLAGFPGSEIIIWASFVVPLVPIIDSPLLSSIWIEDGRPIEYRD